MTDQKVKLKVNNAGQIFFYSGKIISEDEHYIELDDAKEGKIKINRAFVISVQEVQR